MTSSITTELDKTFQSDIGDDYGQMKIRVVVLKKSDQQEDEDGPAEPDEGDLSEPTKKLTDTYLESPKRGKECCVFLINGQRQDAWDHSFIVRDLKFSYLRDRTIIVVDLDGLKNEAIAEIMQGSRQGFYQGKAYHAISRRLIATLKNDPDLDKLQKEAEQNLHEMKGADEAVKNKLDQLIEGHHKAADSDGPGAGDTGVAVGDGGTFNTTMAQGGVVTKAGQNIGVAADLPVLTVEPPMVAVRMHPAEASRLSIIAEPAADWTNLQDLTINFQPEISGLTMKVEKGTDKAKVVLLFTEPEDLDDDEYPLTTELVGFGKFKDHAEPRMVKLPVVVAKPKKGGKKKLRILRPDPTYLRVASRQPVKLMPNSPSLHVRLVWDGEDGLLSGSPPAWGFRARCKSLATFPPIGFAFGNGGRLSVLIDTPSGLIPGSELEFEVEAVGPNEKILRATFKGKIDDLQPTPDQGARRIVTLAPGTLGQRRPPYRLVYVNKDSWDQVECWGDTGWSTDEVGCFKDPTETMPLTLVLNEDFGQISQYFSGLIGRLEEATINERKNKYYSHVAFHLYQMYLNYKKQMEASAQDEGVKMPEFLELRSEINRVGTTLAKLMEIR